MNKGQFIKNPQSVADNMMKTIVFGSIFYWIGWKLILKRQYLKYTSSSNNKK